MCCERAEIFSVSIKTLLVTHNTHWGQTKEKRKGKKKKKTFPKILLNLYREKVQIKQAYACIFKDILHIHFAMSNPGEEL